MSKTGKNILDLESLTKKYDNLIIQYNQAQIDYANYLNTTKNKTRVEGFDVSRAIRDALPTTVPSSISVPPAVASTATNINKDLTSIKGSVVYATNMISQNASTLQQCIALCSADTACKSATFNPIDYARPQCWLNKNEGNVIASPGSNNYAIIPKEKQLLSTIQSLNSQLTDVNSKILQFMIGNKQLYNDVINERNLQFNTLQKNLYHLKLEKNNLAHKIKEFDSLDEEQNYTGLTINKNYYGYVVLLLLFCICIFILIKIAISKLIDQNSLQNLNSVEKLVTVITLLLIIGLKFFFKKKKK